MPSGEIVASREDVEFVFMYGGLVERWLYEVADEERTVR